MGKSAAPRTVKLVRPARIAAVAPSSAPPDTPSVYGSASGLRRSAWSAVPTVASPAPVVAARATRGRRARTTITRSRLSGSEIARASEVGSVPKTSASAHTERKTRPSRATTRALRIHVALVEEAQSVQRQRVVDALDGCRLFRDERSEASGADHGARVAELRLDARDHAVDETRVAEHDARLHRLDGVSSDDAGRFRDLDAVELGGAREECIGADLNSRRDDPAQVFALLAHAV